MQKPNIINRKLKSAKYHASQFFFNHLALPKSKDEKISKGYIKKFLPRNPVMIDCGAHEGKDSYELVRFFNGSIHAFEPVPALYKRLENKMKGAKNSFTYPVALSDSNGTSEFYVSEGRSDGSSSLLPPKDHLISHADTFFREKITVDTLTLDTWAAKQGIGYVDFLWLDMQGFEMNMLQASQKILPTVKVIHTEVSTRETYEGVHQYEAYRNFLFEKGFKVQLEAIPHGWDMGNVLFVRDTKS